MEIPWHAAVSVCGFWVSMPLRRAVGAAQGSSTPKGETPSNTSSTSSAAGKVTLRRYKRQRDRYGREVVQLWVNGRSVAGLMIKAGHAVSWKDAAAHRLVRRLRPLRQYPHQPLRQYPSRSRQGAEGQRLRTSDGSGLPPH